MRIILVLFVSILPTIVEAASFTRGDCDANGSVLSGSPCQITDAVFLLNFLFAGGPEPPCREACNFNDDETLNIADSVSLLGFCFLGAEDPAPPHLECGDDPTPSLACDSFEPCDIDDCSPQDARPRGECALPLGIVFNGESCVSISGCECEGQDCDELFESFEECEAVHGDCIVDCDPMHVIPRGGCEVELGFFFDGRRCRALSGCECDGEDCDELFDTIEECEDVHGGCESVCAPMDAEGRGPCDFSFGVKWDGVRCVDVSGCDCVGEDCDDLFDSMGDCFIRVAQHCPEPCVPMDARGVGECDAVLGFRWDGRTCEAIVGCECVGVDCDRLLSRELCVESHASCPLPCVPMDVREVGLCEPIHGFFFDGTSCRVLSGCTCAGQDCENLFSTMAECLEANADCVRRRDE